jgi:hypothetical protein
MIFSKLTVKHLYFTGPHVDPAGLNLEAGTNLIWGASNTGKSFALDAIDFMLAGSKRLPNFRERDGYDAVWFGFNLSEVGDFTVSRSVSGGAFALYGGLQRAIPLDQAPRVLAPKHNAVKDDNFSRFLLQHLGLSDKFIASNSWGAKESLSFRHLVPILFANETAIQTKRSPVESGQHSDKWLERSVFRLLLSGTDDSAVFAVEDPAKTSASRASKLQLLDELIGAVEAELSSYADKTSLVEQDVRLTASLEQLEGEFDRAQQSIRFLLEEKQQLASDIPRTAERIDDVEIHLDRFKQLHKVYLSDLERLEAIEEAGFLVSLDKDRECPLCGADTISQKHKHDLEEVTPVREAALAEMEKIKRLRADLQLSVNDLLMERDALREMLPRLQQRLASVEEQIESVLPKVDETRATLAELISVRDRVRAGLALMKQKATLLEKRIETESIKPASKADRPALELSSLLAHDFCKVVARVLEEWGFPGEHHVSFDEKTYDLLIDGKLRIDNGKGVRAVTHSAFKVALLLFCRERGLPHPGMVVLDTPLMTYRDPIKNPKVGALSEDEIALAKTPLKQKFFKHLNKISGLGQFILFENIDPPDNITQLANVETFYGGLAGRAGFFPPSKRK